MKQVIIVLYMLAFGNMVFGLSHTPTIGAISETTIGAISESTQGPIWFARTPELTHAAEHQTKFLLCKQAHGGQSRWVDNTAECRKCFCLPDTHQIGCTQCSKSERRMHKRTGPMGQRKIEYGNNGTGLYVNREACVRANSGRVFTRGCTHCVCRQNGSVSCVPIVPCNTKAPRHISANNILADRILVDRFAREQTFGSFSECVQTHGGHQSFKADCNTCSCTETGAVV
ncbi:hypothetical protein IW143_004020, partial [Coemansia sp. RSA 520]